MVSNLAGLARKAHGDKPMKKKPKTGTKVDVDALIKADRAGALDLPLFDENYYNQQLPQFAQQEAGAFEHFITVGEKLGLRPHPVFDRGYVLEQALEAGADTGEGFSPFVFLLENDISPNRLFSVELYRAALKEAGVKPPGGQAMIVHFLGSWAKHRVAFSPYFDVHFYELNNPHLVNSATNPLDHYFRVPRAERSDANPMFHAGYYAQTYQPGDVDPLVDFLHKGCGQLNLPNPYAAQELLSAAFVTPENLLQYIEIRGE